MIIFADFGQEKINGYFALAKSRSKLKVILLTLNNSKSNKALMSFSTLSIYVIILQTPKIIVKIIFFIQYKNE